MKQKLTSRKFWVAVISIVSGVLGILNCDENVTKLIISGLTMLIPSITYIIVEGKIDYTRAIKDIESIIKLIEDSNVLNNGENKDNNG